MASDIKAGSAACDEFIGIITVTYKGYPLGPVKNIGNRANNLYPKPWRIIASTMRRAAARGSFSPS
ncbi:MAG: hypothetical protein K5750_11255, partial [Eubacterium sp.]|nr:hypothetical protein [Eubacterium sp.]